jgi:hypothetical protein
MPRLMTSMESDGRGLSERPPPKKYIFLLFFIPILCFLKKIFTVGFIISTVSGNQFPLTGFLAQSPVKIDF